MYQLAKPASLVIEKFTTNKSILDKGIIEKILNDENNRFNLIESEL